MEVDPQAAGPAAEIERRKRKRSSSEGEDSVVRGGHDTGGVETDSLDENRVHNKRVRKSPDSPQEEAAGEGKATSAGERPAATEGFCSTLTAEALEQMYEAEECSGGVEAPVEAVDSNDASESTEGSDAPEAWEGSGSPVGDAPWNATDPGRPPMEVDPQAAGPAAEIERRKRKRSSSEGEDSVVQGGHDTGGVETDSLDENRVHNKRVRKSPDSPQEEAAGEGKATSAGERPAATEGFCSTLTAEALEQMYEAEECSGGVEAPVEAVDSNDASKSAEGSDAPEAWEGSGSPVGDAPWNATASKASYFDSEASIASEDSGSCDGFDGLNEVGGEAALFSIIYLFCAVWAVWRAYFCTVIFFLCLLIFYIIIELYIFFPPKIQSVPPSLIYI